VTAPGEVVEVDPADNASTVDTTVTALPDVIFEDGFESGSTSAWSAAIP
jgi:hypothetical protein